MPQSVMSSKSSTSDPGSSAGSVTQSLLNTQEGLNYYAIRNGLFTYFNLIRKQSFYRLSLFIAIVQFLQFYSFAFSNEFAWGKLGNVLHYISLIRSGGAGIYDYLSHVTIFWMAIVYIGVFILLFIFMKYHQKLQIETDYRIGLLIQLLHHTYPILHLPLLYFSGYLLSCNSTHLLMFPSVQCWGSENSGPAILSILSIASLTLIGAANSIMYFDWSPDSDSHIAMVNARLQILLYLISTIAAMLDIFVDFDSNALGIFLILGNMSLAIFATYYLPFYSRMTNIVAGACFSASTTAAVIAYVSTLSKSNAVTAMVIWLVFLLPSAFGGFIYVWYRSARLYGPKHKDDIQYSDMFTKPFLVEIATRNLYALRDLDNQDELYDAVSTTLTNGIEKFPNSVELKIAYATFMLTKSHEYHVVYQYVQRALKLNPWVDLKFILFSVDTARQKSLQNVDGGLEEITRGLKLAHQYQDQAKKYLKLFWNNLLKEVELNSISDTIRNVDNFESKAEAVYTRLLHKFPKSVTLLRAYGAFLGEIKYDLECSLIAFRSADELEEANTERLKKSTKLINMTNRVTAWQDSDEETIEKIEEKPQVNLPQNVTRFDILRQKQYLQRMRKNRSSALTRLESASKVTLLASTILIANHEHSINLLHACQISGVYVQNMPINMRKVEFSVTKTGPIDYQPDSVYGKGLATITLNLDFFQNTVDQQLITDLSKSTVKKQWFQSNDTQITWDIGPNDTHVPVDSYANMWFMTNRYGQSIRQLTGYPKVAFESPGWLPEWRYVLDNREALSLHFNKAVSIYKDFVHDTQVQFLQILYILLGTSVLILVVLVIALFVPAILKIKAERKDVLKIFLCIPKSTVTSICSLFDMSNKEIEDEAIGYDMQTASFADYDNEAPVLKKLSYRYGVALVILFAMVCGMFAIAQIHMVNSTNNAPAIMVAGIRLTSAYKLQFLANELILNDNITWSTRSKIQSAINDEILVMQTAQSGLISGSSSLGVQPAVMNSPRQVYVHYDQPCKFASEIEFGGLPLVTPGKCKGLTSLVFPFARDLGNLGKAPEDQFYWNNTLFRSVFLTAEYSGMLQMMEESVQIFVEDVLHGLESMKHSLTAVFAVCFPTLLLAYFLIRPLEQSIRKENERTMRMLLMIPFSVIDSVPAISDYLETGKTEGSAKKIQGAFEENIVRSKSIVDASVDAIIITNAQGIINVFNPASEQMFDVDCSQMIGQSIFNLLPEDEYENNAELRTFMDNIGKRQPPMKAREMVAVRKDSSTFPVQLSLSEGNISGKGFCAAFIRDITEAKTQEKALAYEREKAEKLLVSLLPRTVATILKETGEQKDRPLIAEGYKEVTVLFADIVGFTTWASTIAPSELVRTLNLLFSKWDNLSDKWRLEKIKTIGDCYMVAGGVPDRCIDHAKNVLEFALDMLESLHQFNRDYNQNLRIRIGINSGSVVAGVIGTRKFSFDLWGDTVNVASRMESTGIPNNIQVSQTTYDLLKLEYVFEERGKIQIKGKGTMIAYLYKRRYSETDSAPILILTDDVIRTPKCIKLLIVIAGLEKTDSSQNSVFSKPDAIIQNSVLVKNSSKIKKKSPKLHV